MFVQTAFISYYLSTDIDFVCILCTSSSTAAVASLSLPLSLSLSLFRGTSHNNIAISVPTLFFFRSYNEVFVCVCVFSSHSFWTSSSLDVPAGVTQKEGRTGFLIRLLAAVRALIFLERRIQPFLSLVDREVEFCVHTI